MNSYMFIQGAVVLLAELKLMQAIDVAASSAWGRDTECRKIRVPVPRARGGRFVKCGLEHFLVEKGIGMKSIGYS